MSLLRLDEVTPSVQLPDDERLEILTGVTIEVAVGDHVSVVGRGGSGKSTLLDSLGLRTALENVMTPRLILADEPTGALDIETGASVMSLLTTWVKHPMPHRSPSPMTSTARRWWDPSPRCGRSDNPRRPRAVRGMGSPSMAKELTTRLSSVLFAAAGTIVGALAGLIPAIVALRFTVIDAIRY